MAKIVITINQEKADKSILEVMKPILEAQFKKSLSNGLIKPEDITVVVVD